MPRGRRRTSADINALEAELTQLRQRQSELPTRPRRLTRGKASGSHRISNREHVFSGSMSVAYRRKVYFADGASAVRTARSIDVLASVCFVQL